MARPALTIHGFLVHARPQGERHWICTFFTLEKGKLQCRFQGKVPESARQFESKLIQSDSGYRASDFRYVDKLLLESGPSSYFTLYLNELIYRLLPFEIPDPSVYGCYISSVMQLAAGQHAQSIIRYFEMKLLQMLGMAVDFNRDINNKTVSANQQYRFVAGQGFLPDLQGRFGGERILAAGRLDVDVPGALSVARDCLAQQIEFVTNGIPIVSRRWPLVIEKSSLRSGNQ